MFCATKIFKQRFWMAHFGSPSMKRTILWSTGYPIAAFQVFATMRRKDFTLERKTVEKYTSSSGKSGYKGTRQLKATQFLGIKSPHFLGQLLGKVSGKYGKRARITSVFCILFLTHNVILEYFRKHVPCNRLHSVRTQGVRTKVCWLYCSNGSALQ